jgi:glyoxylase-like metal-dependent hydrolase (beta-lactamase superfamily II)
VALPVELRETGTMIFTSDATYLGDSHAPPATMGNDLTAWYGSVEQLRDIARKTDATVVSGPDRRADPAPAARAGRLPRVRTS